MANWVSQSVGPDLSRSSSLLVGWSWSFIYSVSQAVGRSVGQSVGWLVSQTVTEAVREWGK